MNETVTRDSTILSEARCTQEQAILYLLRGMKAGSQYTEGDIRNVIVPAYFSEGAKAGVDPTVAIAQMIHETGYLSSFWSIRPRRNPAGIGVTGQTAKTLPKDASFWEWSYDEAAKLWKKGLRFEKWDTGSVPAHISRLLGYATKVTDRTEAQKAYVLAHTGKRPLPARVVGCAPTLAGLEGTWAVPGKGYADKLAAHAERITQE
jgi:Mannosyl-glycoprotein endo-beta-N-acetylglucosaminidase